MNKLYVIILLAILSVGAINIAEPAGTVTIPSEPASITAQWTSNGTGGYTLELTQNSTLIDNQTVNATSIQYSLNEGSYSLRVLQGSQEALTTFTLQINQTNTSNQTNETNQSNSTNQTPVALTLDITENEVDVNDIVYITAGSNQPTSATLTISRDGSLQETYALNLDGSMNLIYIPDEAGSYQARLTSGSTSVTDTFTALAPDPLIVDFTRSVARVNQRTNFTSQVSGGQPPYQYQWLFSDNTASTAANPGHFFFEQGPASATLIVTDADGTQESVTKSFTVAELTYSLEVTVRTESGVFLNEADIMAVDSQGEDYEEETNAVGTAELSLPKDNYTLTVEYLGELYINQTVEMNANRNLLFTIDYSTNATENTSTNTTNNTSNTTTPTNVTTNQTVPQPNVSETEATDPLPEDIAQTLAQNGPTEEELRQEALAIARDEATKQISESKFSFQLSPRKDQVLQQLGLYTIFDQAIADLEEAQEEEIESILARVPQEVTILDEQSRITYPEKDDVAEFTQEFLEARNVQDNKLRKQYEKNIEDLYEEVTVKHTVTQASVQYTGQATRYTLITKEVTAPEGTYFIEIIPETLATDVSQLQIQTEHQVVRSNPVLRFDEATFSYSAEGLSPEVGYTLVVPQELEEVGALSGLVTIVLGDGSPIRNIVYIVLLGLLLAGIVAGKKVFSSNGDFESFAELTDQALTLIQQGEQANAASITPEILEIFGTLKSDEQEALQPVIHALKENHDTQQFLTVIQEAYETVSTSGGDINSISSAYEKALATYEGLSESLQTQLEAHIKQLDTQLEHYMK